MYRHSTTEPNRQHRASRPVPFLWNDINLLQDTHSLRIDPDGKGHGSWDNTHVKTVRQTIRAYLRYHDLPTDEGYAVPLYWLYVWLTKDPGTPPLTLNPARAEQARRTLVTALNQPENGLEIVRQRRLEYAS